VNCNVAPLPKPETIPFTYTLGNILELKPLELDFSIPPAPEQTIPAEPDYKQYRAAPYDLDRLRQLLQEFLDAAKDLEGIEDAIKASLSNLLVQFEVDWRKITVEAEGRVLEFRTRVGERNVLMQDGLTEYQYFTLQRASLEALRSLEIRYLQEVRRVVEQGVGNFVRSSMIYGDTAAELARLLAEGETSRLEGAAQEYLTILKGMAEAYNAQVAAVRRQVTQSLLSLTNIRTQLLEARRALQQEMMKIEKADADNTLKSAQVRELLAQYEKDLFETYASLIEQENTILDVKRYAALLDVYRAELDHLRASIEHFLAPYQLYQEKYRVADSRIRTEREKQALNRERLNIMKEEARNFITRMNVQIEKNRTKIGRFRANMTAHKAELQTISSRYTADQRAVLATIMLESAEHYLNELMPITLQAIQDESTLRAKHRLETGRMRSAAYRHDGRESYNMKIDTGNILETYNYNREVISARIIADARVTAELIRAHR